MRTPTLLSILSLVISCNTATYDTWTLRRCHDTSECHVAEVCVDGRCRADAQITCELASECGAPRPCEEEPVCSSGACFFARQESGSECDDGDPCTDDDVCKPGGECTGVPKQCDSGADHSCQDNDTFLAFPEQGRCERATGLCDWQPAEFSCPDCPNTCLAQCTGMTCDGVTDPCLNRGICMPGTVAGCDYLPSQSGTPCTLPGSPQGAEDGVCSDGVCIECVTDEDCRFPPSGDASCHEGTCHGGVCSYEPSDGGRCASGLIGDWRPCLPVAEVCGEQGTRRRDRIFFRCVDGDCGTAIQVGEEPCTWPDERCGDVVHGPWGECRPRGNACDAAGVQERDVTTYVCAASACVPSVEVESRSCDPDTQGSTCASTTYGAWSACTGFSDECDTTGTQSRSVTQSTCVENECVPATSTEERGCTRSVADGTSCGTPPYQVCCNGTCRDTRANDSYCGSCTVDCAAGGMTCEATNGGYACRSCSSNAECRQILDGPGNSNVTCFDTASPPAFCQCQCPSCSSCVCEDGGCGPDAFCLECSGTNVCMPVGGSCN